MSGVHAATAHCRGQRAAWGAGSLLPPRGSSGLVTSTLFLDATLVLICFSDKASLWSLSWPRTHYVDQLASMKWFSAAVRVDVGPGVELSVWGLMASTFPW